MTNAVAGLVEEQHLQGAGGLSIFMRSWRPAGTARAVVVIVPGFNSHSGYYGWVASQLVAANLAVYAVDLRGRGKSDGERYYVDQFSDYVSDIGVAVDAARARESGQPLFILGHSAGGVLACAYALDNQATLAGLICESFAFRLPAPDFALAVLKGLSHVAPHAHVLKLKNADFSRDPAAVAAMDADPLIANEVQPTKTVAELVRMDQRLEQEFSQLTLPVLILHGSADKAASASGSQFFFDNAGATDKTLKMYDGHVHDLLNDLGKDIVMSDILGWVQRHVSG